MTRVTPQSAQANETAWQADTWYRVRLAEYEIAAKGTPGYQGKPRKHPRVELRWELIGTEDLIFDWVDLTVTARRDGTPAQCKLLICALAGRDQRHEPTPWIDDETMEFGFGADPITDTPVGRIVVGVEIALKGEIKAAKDGIDRLNVTRYGPAHLAAPVSPQQVAGPTAMLSADGRYQWNGSQWVPVPAPPPAPPAAVATTPVQQELI